LSLTVDRSAPPIKRCGAIGEKSPASGEVVGKRTPLSVSLRKRAE
jgi:hypothetical protein